ncbi:MAG: ATP-binding protein [Candidatus Azobacteroides sp.]|nr:ATP-binding protein [Candidatus Azobacteroides sp.]
MKLTFNRKIFLCTVLVFTLFAIGVILVEQERERAYKTEMLENNLNASAELIHNYMQEQHLPGNNMEVLSRFIELLPQRNMRVTVIAADGKVLFDNDVTEKDKMENHLDRPEIKKALIKDFGTNIRKSASVNTEYLYCAKYYQSYFIRVALPYQIDVKDFLKTDNVFLYFILVFFVIILFVLHYILNRFGNSINQLRDFVVSVNNEQPLPENTNFPDDELGEVASSVVDIYTKLDKSKKKISLEREKLLQHFHYSEEGFCIFTKDRNKIYANTHFIQFLNVIVDKPVLNPERLFEEDAFKELTAFLNNPDNKSLFTTKISKNGRHFNIRLFIFEDKSFEIIINDVTHTEKTRLVKQEMTNNIAHELRTPITSIRGFLETLINQKDSVPQEKQQGFLERAYTQVIRLSEIVQDISLITKTEEAPHRFQIEQVEIKPLLEELKSDMEIQLEKQKINLEISVPDQTQLNGNRTLLYSIFRNLIENSVRYGGEGIDIKISNYTEDKDFYYFSYYDTGKGVGAAHLNRIFERFYRINEGRTRETGGSGLGLSIVKNAVLFHKGEIVAKERIGGGLEFLFTLKKDVKK